MSVQDFIKKSILQSDNYATQSPFRIVIVLLLALLIGAFIYKVYQHFFTGVIYSRSFAMTLVGMALLTSMVTLAISLIIITSGPYAPFLYSNTRNTGTKFEYTLSDKSFGNPLMGYVPSAEDKTVSEDVHLVYVDITWKELEPKKGYYDWETIEESNQFKRWK